jgi:hypothetical protein
MPRQIIDTQSSRPAYVRRRMATFVAIAAAVLALAAAGWYFMRIHPRTAVPVAPIPGNSAR